MRDSVRINKYLVQQGITSRRDADKSILRGDVLVNGLPAILGQRLLAADVVTYCGKQVGGSKPKRRVFLLNKPQKVLCSRMGEQGRQTVFDLAAVKSVPQRLHYVGRLDYMTSGLLLLTNDGNLTNILCHPANHVSREYIVRTDRQLAQVDLSAIQRGVKLADGVANCGIRPIIENGRVSYSVKVFEGRNRLVRRIFESTGYEVRNLTRVAFGEIFLPSSLPQGQCRELSSREIKSLFSAAGPS